MSPATTRSRAGRWLAASFACQRMSRARRRARRWASALGVDERDIIRENTFDCAPLPDAPIHVTFTDHLFGDTAETLLARLGDRPFSVSLHDIPQPEEGEGRYARRAEIYRTLAGLLPRLPNDLQRQADDLLLRFLREAVPELLSAGLLRLYGLRLDGRIVAGLLALHDGRRAHGYLTGFDPGLGNLGLGSILIGHVMTEAHREGLAEMHFLRGQEPYKYTWGAEDRPTFRRRLERR